MRRVCEIECIEVGNWYSEYRCNVCGLEIVIDAEDAMVPRDRWPCNINKLPPIPLPVTQNSP